MKLNRQISQIKAVTYHHLVDGINNVVHLLSSDVAVVVDIVQAESPCKREGKYKLYYF